MSRMNTKYAGDNEYINVTLKLDCAQFMNYQSGIHNITFSPMHITILWTLLKQLIALALVKFLIFFAQE